MKTISLFLLGIFLTACTEKAPDPDFSEYRNITSTLSVKDFEALKSFILEEGDRSTYCTMYLDNPHYAFGEFDCYLNPETGQRNINCDPELSDFNMMVIQDFSVSSKYFYILLVRNGDTDRDDIMGVVDGMKERKVYLLNYYDGELASMERELEPYLAAMHAAME